MPRALLALAALLLAAPVNANGIINYPSNWKLAPSNGWTPANLTTDETSALKTLCRLALNANGGVWSSDRLNAAIAILAFGSDQPDHLQATVYKVCNYAGGMGRKRR